MQLFIHVFEKLTNIGDDEFFEKSIGPWGPADRPMAGKMTKNQVIHVRKYWFWFIFNDIEEWNDLG